MKPMTRILRPAARHAAALSAGLLIFGPAATPAALAAPGLLSQSPLYVSAHVEPNVVFVNDDSGSMEFSLMTPEEGGEMILRGQRYLYTHPVRAAGNTQAAWRGQTYSYTNTGAFQVHSGQARVLPTLEALEYCFGQNLTTEERGAWRAWNHVYNTMYYNPNVTYEPWVGVNRLGQPYGDANPQAALIDPYDPNAGVEDLTVNRAYTTKYPRGISRTGCPRTAHADWSLPATDQNFKAFYPARYYEWTDSNGNGRVDPDDAHRLVEIRPTGDREYGGTGRTDCAAAPLCTYAEEIQNFANWFSYYRNRDLTAKAAAAAAIADVTGIRVGFATINENQAARTPVMSMNADPVTGNKRVMLDRIYGAGAISGGGTPLRIALNKTGLYFECRAGNIMGDRQNTNCPILPQSQGGMCQKNYTILMTDGFWNDSFSGVGNADGDNNTSWDGGPYADRYSNTLADIAMHYYERDLATSLPNEVPSSPTAKDRAPHQHMTTFTVAFGVSGTLDPETDDPTAPGFAWPNPTAGDAEKIDDLWHAAYNGRGEFYNAQNPDALKSGLVSAFSSLGRGKSSSASVAFNTARLSSQSLLFQASFNPSDNWSGTLTAFRLNEVTGELEEPVWDAAQLLTARNPSSRLILTWNEDTEKGVPFRTMGALSQRQRDDLDTAPDGTRDTLGQARLDYLRGDRSNEGSGNEHEFRIRSAVLGDTVYSSPVFVGPPRFGYDDGASESAQEYALFRNEHLERPPVIYVGANDGMLHGFYAETGEVAISYAPGLLFSDNRREGLHYLTDPAYEHRYYVDLTPTVSDAYVGGTWRTLLIGGFRAGGKGLFALDITNPENFSEAAAEATVLWEFRHPDMGYSFSKPAITQLENGDWVAVFGNGYNSDGGEAKLFIVNLADGSVVRVIDTAPGTHGLSSPTLADTNGSGRTDRVYAGDLAGNLWVFDLSAESRTGWDVAYRRGGTPAPLFTATTGGQPQPITVRPTIVRNPAVGTQLENEPNILVYFGTGQYLTEGDKHDTTRQTFYGVWDNGNRSELTRADLVAQTVVANPTAETRRVSQNAVVYGEQHGWYFDLPASGERVTDNPLIRGEYVLFHTMIPEVNTCDSGGSSFEMALRLASGGNPDEPVWDVNRDGEIDDQDLPGGAPVAGLAQEHILAGSSFHDRHRYTSRDDGEVNVDPDALSRRLGRLSWREVRF